jgi:PAS domain S-box-containing protein
LEDQVGETYKVNILMVDDQPAKLLSYEAILADLDANLIKARSGREGLELLLKHDVAVVLLDVSMPEINGFEMADMMRQHPRFQKTAILFISAVRMSDLDRIKGYQSGAVDYISVPVVPEVLRAKVAVFAELHRKSRELENLNRELENRVEQRTRQLQESEIQFRTLANLIPQLAWMANADGSVFWSNDRWYEYTGISPQSAQAGKWTELLHPDHLARVLVSSQQSWNTGDPWEDTFPMRGNDGEYRWFLARAVPIRDSSGTVVRWFGTNTDISNQIAAEEKILQLNAQLELRVAELEIIMQVLPVGVAVAHDAECKSVTANQALSNMFGIPSDVRLSANESHLGSTAYEFYQNGRRLSFGELPLERAVATRRSVPTTEWGLRRADGKVVPILGSASPLFDSDGRVRGAVGAFFDVSDRKRMEDLLRERADLLELASEAILVRDSAGKVQFWNQGAEALYGWNREEVLAQPVDQVLQTEFPLGSECIESTLMVRGRWDGNLVQHTREGRELIVASRQIFKRETGSILEINRDITAEMKAEEALRKAERLAAMGRVAGIIAHEINNPLEAITNAFYLLRHHPSLDEEAKYYARMGEEELKRVCHITKQTLGFYRESQDPVDVPIAGLIEDVLQLQGRQLLVSRIELDRRYICQPTVRGFPVELRQVFLNLIGNAIQAMPDGGRLRIRIGERWNEDVGRTDLYVSVCDTGTGIRPEHAKRLFEPFFSTKAAKGTGLGLWISKGIIQKYDGTIRFRSIAFKGGHLTSFRVLLPGSNSSALAIAGMIHFSADETVRVPIGRT